MNRIIAGLGFSSYVDFLKKFVMPIVGISIAMFFAVLFLFRDFPFFIPYLLLFIGIAFVFVYPYLVFDAKKTNIQNTIHLFITYAGTISTLSLGRAQIFRKLADKEIYKEISESMKKTVYLASEWKLGFSKSCRRVALMVPSIMFGDFLDRLASALDFGEELDVFFLQEQDAVMVDYETMYRGSLQSIILIKDVFVAITISIAFALASSLLLPLLLGISIIVVIKWCLYGLIFVDIFMVIMIKGMIPDDPLIHNLSNKYCSRQMVLLRRFFLISISLSIILVALFLTTLHLPLLVSMSLATIPMAIVGIFGMKLDNDVFYKDRVFPTFIRAVGNSLAARGGTLLGTIQAVRVHKFGYIDDTIESLYRRLRLGCDGVESWTYFVGESGSHLIKQFIHIFVESIYFGGDPAKISSIISKNFQRVLSLRKLKRQVVSEMRGALYGALVGFTASVFVCVEISNVLFSMFEGAFGNAGGSSDVSSITSAIIPGGMQTVNMSLILLYITIMVIFHAFVSAYSIKLVDGGSKYAMFLDFTAMLALGAIIAWGVPIVFKMLMGPLGVGG
ncbi:MAG: hypothetical protein WC755_01835 [Candidatus Woesearchaeota archaeon]|jgi:flagellar protein FlaJ